jgi:hypothetical protein
VQSNDSDPCRRWQPLPAIFIGTQAIIKFQMADPGTTHVFTMPDRTVRQIKASDFS